MVRITACISVSQDMNYPSIDITKLEFSILLVTPRLSFLSWLDQFLAARGLPTGKARFPEEDSVWLIPPYARLADSYDSFLKDLKPRMFLSEFYRFGASDAEIPQQPSVQAFDNYFELTLRDEAHLYT